MYKVVKDVKPAIPVVPVNQLSYNKNKVVVCVYRNIATILVEINGKFGFKGFGNHPDTHSVSNSFFACIDKNMSGETELYVFDSLKEFFQYAEKIGWEY